MDKNKPRYMVRHTLGIWYIIYWNGACIESGFENEAAAIKRCEKLNANAGKFPTSSWI